MATYYARKAGNINASDVWATTPSGTAGAQTFVSGDVLVSNSFAITVNVSTDLGSTGEVRNDTTGGATAGGSFALSNGVTLTANVYAGSVTCVTLTSTNSATIVGNITGGTSANAYGVSTSSTGTITITGSVTGGTAASAYGINTTTNSSKITITGNITAGSGSASAGAWIDAAAVVITVTGNVTGGSSANAAGIRMRTSAALTLTGNTTGGSAGQGVLVEGTGDINIIGTAIGGSGGTSASAGVQGGSTSAITITRAKGGSTAGASVGVAGVTTGTVTVEEIEYGDLGASPTSGPIRLSDKSSNVAVMYRLNTTKKTLVDANASGLMPSVSDVRFGTIYNGGNSTGTCRIPAASGVAFGVLVDNTTGTAALTPASVWDYLISNISTSGSIGDRLKNCATISTVGQQLSDALSG